MAARTVHMVHLFTPAVGVTVAVLVVSVLAVLALTMVIRRREFVPVPVVAVPEKVAAQRIQRATKTAVPEDVQERLRYLTGTTEPASARAQASATAESPAQAAATTRVTSLPDDTTRRFGDEDPAAGFEARPHDVFDSTLRFDSADLVPGVADDATTFFGSDAAPGLQDDATQFFGHDFAAADEVAPAQDDATQFFGADEDDDVAPAAEDTTRFFLDEDEHEADVMHAVEGGTGFLQALPPRPAAAAETAGTFHMALDDEAEEAPVAGLLPTTGPLSALPPSQPRIDTGALNRVRAYLSSATTPDVVALSVLDSAGRVLAGDADDDLTGELRSLMAESGQGNMADLDQPVQLDDEATGSLLLLPTGANALLGALIRDGDDPQAVRTSLRDLAHEIGDALLRAS